MKERKRKRTLGSRSSKGRTFLGWVDSTSSPFLVHVQCLKECILRLDGMGSTQSEREGLLRCHVDPFGEDHEFAPPVQS